MKEGASARSSQALKALSGPKRGAFFPTNRVVLGSHFNRRRPVGYNSVHSCMEVPVLGDARVVLSSSNVCHLKMPSTLLLTASMGAKEALWTCLSPLSLLATHATTVARVACA
jgi:hypothetical protein